MDTSYKKLMKFWPSKNYKNSWKMFWDAFFLNDAEEDKKGKAERMRTADEERRMIKNIEENEGWQEIEKKLKLKVKKLYEEENNNKNFLIKTIIKALRLLEKIGLEKDALIKNNLEIEEFFCRAEKHYLVKYLKEIEK